MAQDQIYCYFRVIHSQNQMFYFCDKTFNEMKTTRGYPIKTPSRQLFLGSSLTAFDAWHLPAVMLFWNGIPLMHVYCAMIHFFYIFRQLFKLTQSISLKSWSLGLIFIPNIIQLELSKLKLLSGYISPTALNALSPLITIGTITLTYQ